MDTKQKPIIKLKPVKEWTEKSQGYPEGSLRIYVGNFFVGVATPIHGHSEKFSFDSNTELVYISRAQGIEDIKLQVELSLKEFIDKISIIPKQ